MRQKPPLLRLQQVQDLQATVPGKSNHWSPRNKNLPHYLPIFFDNHRTKRQSDDTGSEGRSVRCEVSVIQPKTIGASTGRMDQMSKKGSQSNTSVKGIIPGNFFDYGEEAAAPTPVPKDLSTSHTKVKGVPDGFVDHNKTGSGMQANEPSSETAQAKGSLPEGFFDNKDADLRARGIQPQKVDINDAYKEFEKEIQEDLQEVDDRLEEGD